jgi:molybdate transport system substrate-binding protein
MRPATRRFVTLAMAMLAAVPLAPSANAQDREPRELLVFAASSLTNVLGELSRAYETAHGVPVKLSFAASSVLARQIEAGGKADVFISADQEWMDYLQSRDLIDPPTRRDLVRNRLVLIAPADSGIDLKIAPGFKLAETLGRRRLATGDPDAVPVGRYARSALISLGVWDGIQDRLVRADNVRGALTFVARGEVPLGIVYATDAWADSKVRIVDTFPESSHAPITYPAAALTGSGIPARTFVQFLAGPQARDTWRRFGFLELNK